LSIRSALERAPNSQRRAPSSTSSKAAQVQNKARQVPGGVRTILRGLPVGPQSQSSSRPCYRTSWTGLSVTCLNRSSNPNSRASAYPRRQASCHLSRFIKIAGYRLRITGNDIRMAPIEPMRNGLVV
jgi:hypothetical protein